MTPFKCNKAWTGRRGAGKTEGDNSGNRGKKNDEGKRGANPKAPRRRAHASFEKESLNRMGTSSQEGEPICKPKLAAMLRGTVLQRLPPLHSL